MSDERDSWSGPAKKPTVTVTTNPREVSAFQAARARKEQFKALEVKRQFEDAVADLVEARGVQDAFGAVLDTVRRVLMRWVDQISPQLAPITDPDQVHALLVEGVERVLEEITAEIDKLSHH